MNRPTLEPHVKQAFQDAIQQNLDFGSFTFYRIHQLAAYQYEQAQGYYDALRECPLRAVACDLAAHFDELEDRALYEKEHAPRFLRART